MRPVERGANPGGDVSYGLAYAPLVGRMGRYCSFCEAHLKNGHVEHVLPKDAYPGLVLSWTNFLVACANCNATKGVWPTPALGGRNAFFWPDVDNTARAFEYRLHLPPRAAPALPAADHTLANALLVATGVDRSPTHPAWSEKDDRWELRNEAWEKARECHADLLMEDTSIHRKRVADVAKHCGFWSVWRAVFAADRDMLLRFNSVFVGTSSACFDTNGQPVLRPADRL